MKEKFEIFGSEIPTKSAYGDFMDLVSGNGLTKEQTVFIIQSDDFFDFMDKYKDELKQIPMKLIEVNHE